MNQKWCNSIPAIAFLIKALSVADGTPMPTVKRKASSVRVPEPLLEDELCRKPLTPPPADLRY